MPPSTRAGQMGRGDDDQTTTGNGQEEGWLMQVVRILQLANPALTAEEAIMRAMGLISISNQTPRRETEKIPKEVSSAIVHIKKLSDSNWHTWEPTFIDCLQRVHNAKEILYGMVAPGNEEYNEDLDKALALAAREQHTVREQRTAQEQHTAQEQRTAGATQSEKRNLISELLDSAHSVGAAQLRAAQLRGAQSRGALTLLEQHNRHERNQDERNRQERNREETNRQECNRPETHRQERN
ncbi:uncharacterized protein UHO2_04398 [Ustilago hordei]|uniref:uncharacterized protein n=1 Tax=Ustilago hordei TaxID=120017 RepID=UPI001A5E2546|nr:uncharacterized protein UHO2_04398 [Ustilago hordei]SYW79755.1 uncharacterized protein UHO2_04398 [Ustilago hordei]